MFAHAILQRGKSVGVGRWGAVIMAHMRMANAGPSLKRGMGAFDLFGDGDRHRGVVFLGWQRAGDRDADDTGVSHGGLKCQKRNHKGSL